MNNSSKWSPTDVESTSHRLSQRQPDNEDCSCTGSARCCNASPVPLDYLFADGKAHPGSFIFAPAMQFLEWGENAIEIPLFKADAVILDHDLPCRAGGGAMYLNARFFAFLVEL